MYQNKLKLNILLSFSGKPDYKYQAMTSFEHEKKSKSTYQLHLKAEGVGCRRNDGGQNSMLDGNTISHVKTLSAYNSMVPVLLYSNPCETCEYALIFCIE